MPKFHFLLACPTVNNLMAKAALDIGERWIFYVGVKFLPKGKSESTASESQGLGWVPGSPGVYFLHSGVGVNTLRPPPSTFPGFLLRPRPHLHPRARAVNRTPGGLLSNLRTPQSEYATSTLASSTQKASPKIEEGNAKVSLF